MYDRSAEFHLDSLAPPVPARDYERDRHGICTVIANSRKNDGSVDFFCMYAWQWIT